MSARGNALLLEEKERNKVNRMLPKLEQELHALIAGTYGTNYQGCPSGFGSSY
jgi:hypothetical protein